MSEFYLDEFNGCDIFEVDDAAVVTKAKPKRKATSRKKERKLSYNWKEPETTRLIALVEQRRTLWDLASPEYKLQKNEGWREVAAELGIGIDENEAKVKWQNLRVTFRANVAKRNSTPIIWRFFKEMLFLEASEIALSSQSTSSLDLVYL